MYEQFYLEKVLTQKTSIFETIHKNNFPLCSTIDEEDSEKLKKTRAKNDFAIRERYFSIARERNVPNSYLLTFELSKESMLYTPDGHLKKATKSEIVKKLKEKLEPTDPQIDETLQFCVIVDVMSKARESPWLKNMTWQDYAKSFYRHVFLSVKMICARWDLVFDSCFENSIKSCTRDDRYKSTNAKSRKVYEMEDEIPIPSVKDEFWPLDANKIKLQNYLKKYIFIRAADFCSNCEIVASAANSRKCETTLRISESESLADLQRFEIEEADNRIIIHVQHAVKEKYEKIYVLSNDSDVVVSLMYYWEIFKNNGLKVKLKSKIQI